MKKTNTKLIKLLNIFVVLALLIVAFSAFKGTARASGYLQQTFVAFNRLQVSTATTGTVCAAQNDAGTATTVVVTFPTGYTLGIASTFTVNSTSNSLWPAGASAWPSIATATNVTSQAVTFPSGTLTVATLYCFNWINSAAVTTQSSASNTNSGTVAVNASGPTLIDTGTFITPTLTSDQIVVSASVSSSFSFALSASSDALGTLSSGAVSVSPTPRTVTVNTNARNGWYVWGKDAYIGLESLSNPSELIGSTTPGTNSTLAAGTAGYNTGVTQTETSGSGVTVAAPFVGGSTGKGGGLNTTYAILASSTGPANAAVMTLTNNAAISAITPAAADYSDTITVVGAADF
ncbi:MAG TPA: hypothetical protein VMR95_01090 [Candidatus Binatia bacterium]|nr:hypothetical protein [Candidatus Binatia bacterium]